MNGPLSILIRVLRLLGGLGKPKTGAGLSPEQVLARLTLNAMEAPELEPDSPANHRPPRTRPKRRHVRKVALGVALVAALVASAAGVLAYFTGHGSGTASASTGSLAAPTNVHAIAHGSSVAVTWDAVTPPSSGSVDYTVTRAGTTSGTACASIATTTCTDTGLASGDYTYTVHAAWHSWSSSATSNQVATLDHLTVAPTGISETAGTPFDVTVTAVDHDGATMTAYTGTVSFTSSDADASLPAAYPFTTGDAGVHTFSSGVTLRTAGTGMTVTAHDGSFTGSASYTVTQATPTLSVSAPITGTAGVAITGSSITAQLSGSSGPNATGTVTFKVFGPSVSAPITCTGGTTVGTASVSGNGTVSSSDGFTPGEAGNYWWYAGYGGDSNNNPANSGCGAGMTETVVAQATPTLNVSAPAAGTAGTAISKTTVSADLESTSGANASGTVTFAVYGPAPIAPSTCQTTTGGSWTQVGTASVSGNGTVHPSSDYTPSQAGTYWWYALYGGDANNTSIASTCGSLMASTVVGKASPTVSTTPSAGVVVGNGVSDQATMNGGAGPTGSVTFTLYSDSGCSTSVFTSTQPLSGGTATSTSYTTTAASTYYWKASYAGDSNNNGYTTSCGGPSDEKVVVSKASPSISTTPSAGVIVGGNVSDSASLNSSYSPTGNVVFTLYSDAACTTQVFTANGAISSASAASGNYATTAAGVYYWQATYAGDSNNNSATTTCGGAGDEKVIVQSQTSLTVTAPATDATNTAIAAANITGSLTGGTSPTGTITFAVYGPSTTAPTTCQTTTGGSWKQVGTASASGNNTYPSSASFTPTSSGTYWWYAAYGGDTINTTSTTTCNSASMTHTVVGAVTSLTATGPANGTAGTPIATSAITAGLTGGSSPTGTITFKVFGPQATAPTDCSAGTTVGTAAVSGNNGYHPSASFTPSSSGTYWWYASYSGDGNNLASASTCGATMSSTSVNLTLGPGSHTLTIPAGITSVGFTLVGGGGAGGGLGTTGGAGASITGTITLASNLSGVTLTVNVGAGGTRGTTASIGYGKGGAGGGANAGAGGAASAITASGGAIVVVSGGGGGAGEGGAAGGPAGISASPFPVANSGGDGGSINHGGSGGSGGSTSSGGVATNGGAGSPVQDGTAGGSGQMAAGGGGGGFGGGAGGTASGNNGHGGGGGGGGSSYTGGASGYTVAVTATSNPSTGNGAAGSGTGPGGSGAATITGQGITST